MIIMHFKIGFWNNPVTYAMCYTEIVKQSQIDAFKWLSIDSHDILKEILKTLKSERKKKKTIV